MKTSKEIIPSVFIYSSEIIGFPMTSFSKASMVSSIMSTSKHPENKVFWAEFMNARALTWNFCFL